MEEIKDQLGNGEFGLKIVRNLGSSTTALFGIFRSKAAERLELAGTGTMVRVEGCHGILTAAHVWEKALKDARQVGISLTENIDHNCGIDVATIAPIMIKSAEWNEHGPDLAFLRIPKERVGAIEAYKVFENLNRPPKMLGVDGLECWFAIGTPKELGEFTPVHASVAIRGDIVDPKYVSGEHDYYDFVMDTSLPGAPKSYGGASGGGLWRIVVYSCPITGKVDWSARLKGVMFWQFPEADGCRIIRSHGPNSILAIAKMLMGD